MCCKNETEKTKKDIHIKRKKEVFVILLKSVLRVGRRCEKKGLPCIDATKDIAVHVAGFLIYITSAICSPWVKV